MTDWRQFFQEPNGRYSSRRLAGLVAAFGLVAVLLAQAAGAIVIAFRHPELPAIPLDTQVVWGCVCIALGGLGLTTIEKLSEHRVDVRKEEARATVAMRAMPEGAR